MDLTNIKNFMAGGTDEEPANLIIFFIALQHGVETISVSATGTGSKFIFENNLVYCITHGAASYDIISIMRQLSPMGKNNNEVKEIKKWFDCTVRATDCEKAITKGNTFVQMIIIFAKKKVELFAPGLKL